MEPTGTAGADYAARLQRIQMAGWKHRLRRFDPYGAHLRSLKPGRTFEVGCGIGRNLAFLAGNGVGVDHNPEALQTCRRRGFTVWTPDEVPPPAGDFDTVLFSHILEHLDHASGVDLVSRYLPWLKGSGRVVIITPQERGFRADPTHVSFVDYSAARTICRAVGLTVTSQHSFPFSRLAGRAWVYNEFVTVAVKG